MKDLKKPEKEIDKQGVIGDFDSFDDLDIVASATECTGLIPTPPTSEAESEAYASIYSIPQPSVNQQDNKPDSKTPKA